MTKVHIYAFRPYISTYRPTPIDKFCIFDRIRSREKFIQPKEGIRMKKKILSTVIAMLMILCQGAILSEEISQKAQEFASQYPYKEGDVEKSFSYPFGDLYTSGIEKREDGVEYECPAIYRMQDCIMLGGTNIELKNVSIFLGDTLSKYSNESVIYNSCTIVPVNLFEELECKVDYNDELCVTKITKDDVTLEIMPYLIGMRKNGKEGYWIPLQKCAVYIEDNLYIPLRTVAEELGISVNWDENTKSVTLL